MTSAELHNVPLELQIAAAAGFLAYCVAYAGLRRGHSAGEAAAFSLAFGLIGVLTFRSLAGSAGDVAAAAAAAVLTLLAGVVWRARGRGWWAACMIKGKVHQDDGTSSAWDALIQSPNFEVYEIIVGLTNGTALICEDTSQYIDAPLRGLSLGSDGGIVMVAEIEEAAGVKVRRPDTGVRLVYIPPSMIARVEMRVARLSASAEAVTPETGEPG